MEMRKAGLGHRLGAGLVSLFLFAFFLVLVDLAAEITLSDVSELFAPRTAGVPSDGPQAAAELLRTIFAASLLIPVTAMIYGLLGLLFGKTPGQALLKISILGQNAGLADWTQRLRRYLVTYGWAWVLFVGMLAAFAIEANNMAWADDFMLWALLSLSFVAAVWLAVLLLDPLIRALGDREVFFVDKASGTMPYVKQR